jgi:hypothetical protein
MFTQHSPFLVKIFEVPMNSPTTSFNSTQVCDLSRIGDYIQSITLKITLPSLFQTGYGLAYPSQIISPTFYYLDAGYNIVATYTARNLKPYFSTNDTNWLPSVASINGQNFQFTGSPAFIAFKDLSSALFWGFKNFTQIVNNLYIWPFTGTSEITLFSGGWVNANSNYFRYYLPLNLIQQVELYIGGQLIESIPGAYITLYNDLNYENQQYSLSNISGTTRTIAASDIQYFVKVPFSLTNIPVSAITNQTVEVRVTIGDSSRLLESNALNITNFSNVGSFPVASSATTDGVSDYIMSNGTLIRYINGSVVSTYSIPGATGIATDYSNIFAIAGNYCYKYNPSSNTSQQFYIPGTSGYSPTTAVNFNQLGLFCYGTGLQIFSQGFQTYEFPFTCTGSTTVYNSLSFVATTAGLVVQSTVTPYIYTNYIYLNGPAIQLSSHPLNGMYYTTASALLKWTGAGFTQVLALPAAPNCMVVVPDRVLMYYSSNVIVYPGGLPISITRSVKSAQYLQDRYICVIYDVGIDSIDYTNPAVGLNATSGTTVFTTLFINGQSNIYAIDNQYNMYTYPRKTSFINGTPYVLPPSGYNFAYDSVNSIVYVCSNSSGNVFTALSTGVTKLSTQITNVSNLKSLFYDGTYMYSFPVNGNVAYKLNTTTDFTANSSHYLSFITDNFGNQKTMYAGGVAFDGTNLIVSPLASDQNVLVYNTTLPFIEPTAYFQYSNFLVGGRDYPYIATFKNLMFFGSNSLIYRYTYSPGYSVSNFSITQNNIGSITDGRNYLHVFNNSAAVSIFPLGSLSQPSQSSGFPGKYGYVLKQNSDVVWIIPTDNSNLLSYSMSTSLKSGFSSAFSTVVLTQGGNFSNTACIAGTNMYIFPGPPSANLYIVNLTTQTVSNIILPVYNYQGAVYDNFRYIYTTDPYGNLYRLNTTTDLFTDFPGWSISAWSNTQNVVSRSSTLTGNVYFAGISNIFVTNISTRITANIGVSFDSSPIISRQNQNSVYFITTGNLWQFATTVTRTPILDRSTTVKTPLDITMYNNVYISWSDSSVGTLDLSSNDFSGVYYIAPIPAANGVPTNSVIVNSNVYVTTSDNISCIGSVYNLRMADASNVYKLVLVNSSNLYALPSNGSVFVKVTDGTLAIERYTSQLVNVGCATIYGSTLYAFSRTSNTGVAIPTTTTMSKGTNVIFANAFANGFSCCFVSSDSYLYILPYASNLVMSYSTATQNFSNSSLSSSFIGPISNVVAGSTSWLLAQNGYMANVLSGTIGSVVPTIDYIHGRYQANVAPLSASLQSFYFGSATVGAPVQTYGPIQLSSTSLINLNINGTISSSNLFALWNKYPTTWNDAIITNHSWYSLTFSLGGVIYSLSGICVTASDLTRMNSSLPAFAKWTTSGSTVTFIASGSPGYGASMVGTIGTLSVNVSVPVGSSLQFRQDLTTALLPKTASVSGFVYIIADPGTLQISDFYWNTLSTSNIIPTFANDWLATQDATVFLYTAAGALTVYQNPSTLLYDSIFAIASNVVVSNTNGNVLMFSPGKTKQGTIATGTVNLGYSSPYIYALSEVAGVASVNMYDMNFNLISPVSVNSSSVIGSRISLPISDGSILYIQNKYSNITVAGIGYTQSFDYVTNWGISLQNYSCVISLNNQYYVTPSSGNVILQVTSTSATNLSVIGYDVNNVLATASQYSITASLDRYSNIIFTCLDPVTHVANLVIYNTLSPLNVASSWSTPIKAGNVTSNVSIYSGGYSFMFSNVDSNVVQFSLAGSPAAYYSYQYPAVPTVSNVTVVSGGIAYMFPSTASSNIVTFNTATKAFGFIAHDQPVLAQANVGQYTVIVNPTKINVFQTNIMTSVQSSTFTNPSGIVYSTAYDGRYLNVLTGSGRVTFDFSNLSKVARPIYGNVYYTMVSTGTSLLATNLQSYFTLGFSPRPYTESIQSGPVTGMYVYNNSLYGKVGGTIQNITQGSLIDTSTSTAAIDSAVIGSTLYILSSDMLTYSNLLNTNSGFSRIIKPSEYSSEILTDGSNIFVPSVSTLNVWRLSTLSQIDVAQNTFVSTGTRFVNQYYESSNLVLTTDTNQRIVFNPNPTSVPPLSNTFLPFQSQNNYASIIVNQNIYFFPGNVNSSIVQVFNSLQPFNISGSFSPIYIANCDVRSLTLNGTKIIGTPYASNSFVILDTVTNQVNTYYIDTTTNVASNGYIQSVFAGQSYYMIPSKGSTLRRIYPSQLITTKSFSLPLLQFTQDLALNGMVTFGSNLLISTTTKTFIVDMTNPTIGQLVPSQSLYAAGNCSVYYDGRFVKFVSNTITLYDTMPITIPTSLQLSCITKTSMVSSKEVSWMKANNLDYVFERLQTSNVSSGYYQLHLTGPVTEIMMTGNVTSAELFLNGYSKSKLDSTYMGTLVPYWNYARTPNSNVYIVPMQPFINMSRIREQVLYLNSDSVTLYAKSLNVLRVKDGFAGLIFNN